MASKKNFFVLLISALLLSLSFSACNNSSADHWSDFVPESTFFVLVPDSANSVEQMLATPLMPMLDDITPSVMQMITTLQSHTSDRIIVDALLLHPSSSDNWEPAWVTRSIDGLESTLTRNYQEEYEQNQYEFRGFRIEKLFIADRVMFMVSFDEWTIFSQSSFALESILRSLVGIARKLELTEEQYQPGSIIMNTERMDQWVQQLSQVMSRPFLNHIFEEAAPISFQSVPSPSDDIEWQLRGTMEVHDGASDLVTYLTQPASEFSLDRFIPVDAAAFSIFRVDQQTLPNSDNFAPQNELDRYLQNNQMPWHNIQQNLRNEVAFVSFANSGPSSSSEYLFLRSVSNAGAIQSALNNLADDEHVLRDENTYFINSYLLGKLLGSNVFPIRDFYVTVYDNVLAIAQRKGLAESVGGDAARRRVLYYDDGYESMRGALPRPLSSIHYVDAAAFGTYIQPWLFPQNYMNTLISNLDEFVITTRLEPGSNSLDVRMTSFQQETQEYPFTEQWVFPLGGSDITGSPVLADLTGSARNEVVFANENGYVYALATDGTVILQASTIDDQPIGPPIVYDWYGNNQNIIMQAAGNKIYAWNQSGTVLPNFPIRLDENITTPLTVTDITGNGVAEMIVATADRQMHILNARGQEINGWPQSTNSVVESSPLIAEIDNLQSLFAFSENTLHAWNVTGERRNNFPAFLTAQLQGSPQKYENSILGSGLDGNLYSVGAAPLFSDTLSNIISADVINIQSLPVSNSSLNTTPSTHEVLMTTENDEFERKDVFLLQASNGSVFLYDVKGELEFTQSLGQPSSANFPPIITDINSDQREDLIALADFGRLYAWDILSGERHNELPTSGMNYPIISDFLGNGKKEIIAQTRDGLQCWTINYTVREATANN